MSSTLHRRCHRRRCHRLYPWLSHKNKNTPKQERKNKKCFVCTSQDNAQTIDSATDEHKEEEKKTNSTFFLKLSVGTFLHIRDNPMLIKRKMCARIRTQNLHVFSFVRSLTGHSRERKERWYLILFQSK